MKNSISELARARNDDWGQAIVERLEQVTDLVAADAQYHNSCMKKLYQTPSTEERKKRGPRTRTYSTHDHLAARRTLRVFLDPRSEAADDGPAALTKANQRHKSASGVRLDEHTDPPRCCLRRAISSATAFVEP
ncbi:hypothetical protein EVAR_5580_1 [Eumeta japonica]|uniref:Uncharacterized protein n=1 Tax=Eumeta variegata TaxID=151549 RepID=A0A4C1U1M1_EUMVA|nr:hypothetical protein EVAR_5580_1 [Eumeta japonica]